MYYQGRWEREFFDEQFKRIPLREPIWLICLLMLLGPLVVGIISALIAVYVENGLSVPHSQQLSHSLSWWGSHG